MFITSRLIKIIELHTKYIVAQCFIEIGFLGYTIGQSIEDKYFDTIYLYIYLNFLSTLICSRLILRDLKDCFSVLYMAHQINETCLNEENFYDMKDYHYYYKDDQCQFSWELLKGSIKFRFHIYIYTSYHFIQYLLLLGFIPLLIQQPKQLSIPQMVVISSLLLLNLFDILETIAAIFLELPGKIKGLIKQIKKQRKLHKLIAESECLICMSELNQRSIQLGCHPTHIFHESCLHLWFHEKKTCPTCRKFVDKNNLTIVVY